MPLDQLVSYRKCLFFFLFFYDLVFSFLYIFNIFLKSNRQHYYHSADVFTKLKKKKEEKKKGSLICELSLRSVQVEEQRLHNVTKTLRFKCATAEATSINI